jgi:hypothetical protein
MFSFSSIFPVGTRASQLSFRGFCGFYVVDLIGSSGRIRTYNPSVNSRMLLFSKDRCRPPIQHILPEISEIFAISGAGDNSTPRLLVTGRKFRESLPCPCSVGRGPLGARGADGTARKCPFTPTEFGDSGSPPAVPRAEIPRIIAPSSTRMLALPNSTAQEFREWFPPGLRASSRETADHNGEWLFTIRSREAVWGRRDPDSVGTARARAKRCVRKDSKRGDLESLSWENLSSTVAGFRLFALSEARSVSKYFRVAIGRGSFIAHHRRRRHSYPHNYPHNKRRMSREQPLQPTKPCWKQAT